MPPSSPTQHGGASHKRRQYAKDQTAAYDYSGGSISGGIPPPAGPYAAQPDPAASQQAYPGGGQQQFFSPAFGDPAMHQQPTQNKFYGNSGPNYQGPIGPGAPVHGRSFSQQYPGQQQGYQQPAVAGLSNQFGQMGISGQRPVSAFPCFFLSYFWLQLTILDFTAQVPLQTTNLIGLQLDPRGLEDPPPEIRLPPGVSCFAWSPEASARLTFILSPQASFSQSPHIQADPSWQRCTLNAFPANHSVLQKSRLPLSLVVTPYRSVKADEGEEAQVPVVSDTVIARCRRCRTYINPYVTFLENGNRWKCCMCNLSNEVPQLFDWDQTTNQPADRWKRAELNHAVVDFVAPTEYMVRPPQALVYVFLIDVSYPAVNSGT